jgi:hypothetical protein
MSRAPPLLVFLTIIPDETSRKSTYHFKILIEAEHSKGIHHPDAQDHLPPWPARLPVSVFGISLCSKITKNIVFSDTLQNGFLDILFIVKYLVLTVSIVDQFLSLTRFNLIPYFFG